MYNCYLSPQTSYTPVEPSGTRQQPVCNTNNNALHRKQTASWMQILTQNRNELSQWLREKTERSGSNLLENWSKLGIDRGDILLVLILLLLMTQEEEGDLLLALGAVLFFDAEKKTRGDE